MVQLMGVGAQNDLGGHRSFARKMTWKLPDKLIIFSVQIEVTSKTKTKKKVFTQIEPVFQFNLWWSQKKMFFTRIETVFLSSARNILLGKLAQTTEISQNFDAILPKKYEIAWNFDAKLPKIYEIAQNFARNLDTLHQPRSQCPPAPSPTSYAYGSTSTLVTLLRPWIRHIAIVIFVRWLRTSSKFSGKDFEEIRRNIGSLETAKQVQIPPITEECAGHPYLQLASDAVWWQQKISGRMDRASATEKIDTGSILGRVKPKAIKIKIGIHNFPIWRLAMKKDGVKLPQCVVDRGSFTQKPQATFVGYWPR